MSVQNLSELELEREISRVVRAMSSRDRRIGKDIITDLRLRFPLKDVAGLLIVSLERLLWLDSQAFVWAVENMIPRVVMREIRSLMMNTICKNLIDQGLTPGEQFSMDAQGQLLLAPELTSRGLFNHP